MTPSPPEDRLFGPSESDIERAERRVLQPPNGGASTAVWKILAVVIALIATMGLVLNILLPLFPTRGSAQEAPVRTPARVVGVVDGTTLLVDTDEGRERVKYIGVESHVPGSPEDAYAAEVSRGLVVGKDVLLEADSVDRDGDMLLRYVIVDDMPINLLMVATGVARADLEGPNDRYRDLFRQFEQSARNQQLGIWSSAGTAARSFQETQYMNDA